MLNGRIFRGGVTAFADETTVTAVVTVEEHDELTQTGTVDETETTGTITEEQEVPVNSEGLTEKAEATEQTQEVAAPVSQEELGETPSSDGENSPSSGATGDTVTEGTQVTQTDKGLLVQYTSEIQTNGDLLFAVWSETNGQDDIKWYTADNDGKATALYTGDYGLYYIHTYLRKNGRMTFLDATAVSIDKPAVTVHQVPAYMTSIVLPTWTSANGQDDIKWYATQKNSDGTYSATIHVANHKLESGTYTVHIYGKSAVTGSLTPLAATGFTNEYQFGDVEVTASLGAKGIELRMPSQVSQSFETYHAVWSEKNGQDDIKWYRVGANGQTKGDYTDGYGNYLVHTYAKIDGQMKILSTLSVAVAKPDIQAEVTKIAPVTYQVTLRDVPVYISDIVLPTWSSANGQDDIKWYRSKRQVDGTYTATVYALESGDYNLHVYGQNVVTGGLAPLVGQKFTSDYRVGDVAIETNLGTHGLTVRMPSDLAQHVKTLHAVWSEKNGQDDIRWYAADASGQTTVAYTGGYDTYHIHTYAEVGGKLRMLHMGDVTVSRPEVTTEISKVGQATYRVDVKNVPDTITEVTLPTWTNAGGQDDIQWVKASRNSDGSYSGTISVKKHGFESGHYTVHVYGYSTVVGGLIGLSGTDGFDFQKDFTLTNPVVTVQRHQVSKGTIEVVISETETSKELASVSIAAWSQSGQKNIHWYQSSQVVDGKIVVEVDERYHHNIAGDYTIHAYVKTKNGETLGHNVGRYALQNTDATAKVVTTYKGTGNYLVTVTGVYSSGAVKYAVWSDAHGQNDLRWYDAITYGTTAYGTFNAVNHSDTGVYHLHVYQNDNGAMYALTTTDFTVRQNRFDTPYYSQRDGRWGGLNYGGYTFASTGCVPTSLAMVFSSLTNSTILPTAVGDYLYTQTNEFNKDGGGTSSAGILRASEHWGMSATALGEYGDLVNALNDGYHVVAAVQQNKFVRNGTHEIVLKGYSNDSTYVLDPYNAANAGWYSVDALWREQSTDPMDLVSVGRPFVKITKLS